jgi:serine/threonine protein kinase
VMELLAGLDLQELVRRHGPLPAARTIHFLLQVCESLEEAHSMGLIHRDIKPANIYSCRSGNRFDFAKVLDFGLVTKGGVSTGIEIAATMDGHSIAGTPAYMPPEMARGGPIDGRTDLYALGCVAFYLLTGRTVFDGGTPLDVILSHASKVPELPSKLAELPVPPELDAVIAECLAKEPDQRPRTAHVLARRLREIPVDPWTEEQAQRWWEKHGNATAPPAFSS